MNPPDRLISLVSQGHELMARERDLLLLGEFEGVAHLTADKHGLLQALEAAMKRARGTEPVRAALAALIADSRRNERIILAAIATGRGAVAYDRDGTAITSRDDATQKSSRA
jgi:hypothetical protein